MGLVFGAVLADLRTLAEGIPELDAVALGQCVTRAETQSEVDGDLLLADAVGVSGTDSLIVGNQGYEAPSLATLQAAIEQQQVQD